MPFTDTSPACREKTLNILQLFGAHGTFDGVSDDLLGEVGHRTPGGAVVGTAGVAEPSHVLARHQLVGL